MTFLLKRRFHLALWCCVLVIFGSYSTVAVAQRKRSPKQSSKPTTQPVSELDKLRAEYLKTTKEYKTSLENLLSLYPASEQKAEKSLAQLQQLFTAGFDSNRHIDESQHPI